MSGYSQLVSRYSGKVLDVASCATGGDGAKLRPWTWAHNDCQQFKLEAL